MKITLLTVLIIGMAVECQTYCFSKMSDYGKFGCNYDDTHFLRLDDYYVDDNKCLRCHCMSGGVLDCCSEEVIIKEAPPGCKIKHEGCNDYAAVKFDPRIKCTQGITAILL